MASFEIPDGPTTVSLKAGSDPKAPRTGSIVFTVNNKATDAMAGRLSVQVAGQTKAEWFTIDGEPERDFPAGGSQTASIKIAVPPTVAPGDYPFRLRVVAVNDPDNDHTEGPVTTTKVPGAVVVEHKGLPAWAWIVIALVVVALIAGTVLFFVLRKPSDDTNNAVANSTIDNSATPVDVTVPDLVGKTVDQAKPLTTGFELTPVAGTPSGKVPNTIMSQSPIAGGTLQAGYPIKVVFDPGVVVPALAGLTTDAAVNKLSPLGLHVNSSTTRCETSGTAGQIVAQTPAAGQTVASTSGVDITVRTIGGKVGTIYLLCNIRYLGALKANVQPQMFKMATPATTSGG
jgi:serine/threonine-protein kinase